MTDTLTAPPKTPEADDALVFECDLDAPPEKVWRALATPELRAAWLGEPESGEARVLEAEPGSRLVLGWPSDGRDSTVTFEIEPGEEGGAHLTIVHAPVVTTARVIPFPGDRTSTTATTMSTALRMAA